MPSAFGEGKGWDDDDKEGGEGLSSSEEAETSNNIEVESGADYSKVEEGQMMAHPPPSMGGVATIGGGAVVRSKCMDLVLLDGVDSAVPSSALELCKPGDKMPGGPPKQLYTVLQETVVDGN